MQHRPANPYPRLSLQETHETLRLRQSAVIAGRASEPTAVDAAKLVCLTSGIGCQPSGGATLPAGSRKHGGLS